MVFQQPTLFPGTVRDNLLVAAPDSGDDELRAGLERVALDMGLLDRDAASLSGGEAQRLCLARTLLADPRVLLLDEPTSALDATPRLGFEPTIRQLADAGMPVLWVTHDLEQVLRIADQLIVLDAGRVALVLDDVTGASRHPIVARLFDPESADGNR